jgi:hypothetical protein
MTEIQALRRAQEAFARRAWAESYRYFEEADGEAPLEPEDLERLATAASLIGREAESEACWEARKAGCSQRPMRTSGSWADGAASWLRSW